MGRVTSQDCDPFRGLIALLAIGRLPETEKLGLAEHLEGCRDCREDRRELTELSALLPKVDLGHLDEADIPAGLSGKVLNRLNAEARRDRRKRGLRVVCQPHGTS